MNNKKIFLIAVLAILAYFFYQADMNESKAQFASQYTKLVDGTCFFYDGWKTCQIDKAYCDLSGKQQPISLGFCEKLMEPGLNRMAVGDACVVVEDAQGVILSESPDCDNDEVCIAGVCEDPNHPAAWSNATFDSTAITEIKSDVSAAWQELEIQKKYLWYGLFFGVSVMLLFLFTRKGEAI